MSHVTKRARIHRLLSGALGAMLLSGCVTISDPVMVGEPSPIPPSPTAPVVTLLEASPTPMVILEKVVSVRRPLAEVMPVATTAPKAEPTSSPLPTATATPAPIVYIVESGDSLGFIAQKHEIALSALLDLNGLEEETTINVGDALVIPSASDLIESVAQSGTPIPTPQTDSGHFIHYVQVGETLSAIAGQYGIERRDLLLANGLRPDAQLVAGDTLIVPQGPYVAIPTATPEAATPVPTVVVALIQSPTAEPSATAEPVVAEPVTHTVKAGEIAGRIAKDYNVSLDELADANPDIALDRLSVGQIIEIPGAVLGASVAAALPTVTPLPSLTPIPPVLGTHVVEEGETLATLASEYETSQEEIRTHNEPLGLELSPGAIVQVPLGTATPTPTPRPRPTATATPAPAFLPPVPLLPANDSTLVYRPGKSPLQLVWTSTGRLGENEFYVARLRAVNDEGDVLWSETHWSKTPNWRVDPALLAQTKGRVLLRWDVMVMRETTTSESENRSGVALSDKSTTHQIRFTNRN